MPLCGLSSLARTEADARAAGRPLRSFLPSTTYWVAVIDTVGNLRRDAVELQCTAPFEQPDGPETAIG